jgi:hypothetical protein
VRGFTALFPNEIDLIFRINYGNLVGFLKFQGIPYPSTLQPKAKQYARDRPRHKKTLLPFLQPYKDAHTIANSAQSKLTNPNSRIINPAEWARWNPRDIAYAPPTPTFIIRDLIPDVHEEGSSPNPFTSSFHAFSIPCVVPEFGVSQSPLQTNPKMIVVVIIEMNLLFIVIFK